MAIASLCHPHRRVFFPQDAMLWTLNSRTTQSGTVFSAWTGVMNFAPLLLRAVELESDDQEDCEDSDDDSDDIDDEWPPLPIDEIDDEWPPPDPMSEVDDLPPAPPTRKRRASLTFDDVVAAGPAHSGPHHSRKPHIRCAVKRTRQIEEQGHAACPSAVERHVRSAEPIHVPSFDASTLPVSLGAYAGKTENKAEKYGAKKRRTLAELIGLGFQLICWNGINPHPLVDRKGRIFMVLVGQIDDTLYRAATARAFSFIKQEGITAEFPAAMRCHRRGLFATTNVGLTFGKGQTVPTWLDNKNYTGLAERLLCNPDVTRMATFASTFNFGTNVWTFKHCDVCNLPFGLCAVQSLGNFDAQAGGHLMLWDLKLVVEFPAGALILLPLATIAHSNIPVQEGDERVSFTQFTAGGLFRFVDAGLRTQAELAAEDPGEYERLRERQESRWAEGLNLFSTVEELSSIAVELQSVAV
ncbi:hypothetical protein DFH08DRAFT_825446 [Mycena albidolilacea]|uniref:Uncharacterized protein n=1 Tax=Mycena albidolilacea TaxID=1033008 RepID=A0AAD7E9G3_9AGAR|nr:hypothetical protein DFH08DRAFT_825446 [Mycena albidolilacea]